MQFILYYVSMVVMIVLNTAFVMYYFGVKKVSRDKIVKSSFIIGLLWPIILMAVLCVLVWSVLSFLKNRVNC